MEVKIVIEIEKIYLVKYKSTHNKTKYKIQNYYIILKILY